MLQDMVDQQIIFSSYKLKKYLWVLLSDQIQESMSIRLDLSVTQKRNLDYKNKKEKSSY